MSASTLFDLAPDETYTYASLESEEKNVPKRTYQPKRIPRKRTHGFRSRMSSPGGRKVLQARRKKGRYKISI